MVRIVHCVQEKLDNMGLAGTVKTKMRDYFTIPGTMPSMESGLVYMGTVRLR